MIIERENEREKEIQREREREREREWDRVIIERENEREKEIQRKRGRYIEKSHIWSSFEVWQIKFSNINYKNGLTYKRSKSIGSFYFYEDSNNKKKIASRLLNIYFPSYLFSF